MRHRRVGSSRRGFTTVELIVVSGLTVLLTMILGTIWAGFCRPSIDAANACAITLEANFAAASLARDLGGSLADPDGRLGSTKDAVYVGRSIPTSDWLRLCFHGGTSDDLTPTWATPDVVVSYQVQGETLVRWNEKENTSVVVASHVSAFTVEEVAGGGGVTIALTFTVRGVSRTYTLVAVDPPAT